jgi:DNA transformation protein
MDADGLKELFEPFGAVSVRRMFGGHGIYAEGLFFALEIDGEIYLKSDAESEAVFAAAGSTPFVYQGHTRPIKVNLWRMTAGAYDEPDELKRWSGLALAAARSAAQAIAGEPKPGQARRPAARAKTARKN